VYIAADLTISIADVAISIVPLLLFQHIFKQLLLLFC